VKSNMIMMEHDGLMFFVCEKSLIGAFSNADMIGWYIDRAGCIQGIYYNSLYGDIALKLYKEEA